MVQQIDPIYVNFTQSASDVLQAARTMEAGQLKRTSGVDAASVRIVLEDGSEYKLSGRLLFADLTVDSSTSQVTRAPKCPTPRRTAAGSLRACANRAGHGGQRDQRAAAGRDAPLSRATR